MAISRNKKESIVKKIKDIFSKAKTIVFVRYAGVTSEETNKLRKGIRDENVGYFVFKKRLLKLAIKDASVKGDLPQLDGEIGIVYGEDSITPARLVREFSKEFKNKLEIVGGVYEGEYIDASSMSNIANIPSIPVLHTQFVSMLNLPIQSFAICLGKIAEKKK